MLDFAVRLSSVTGAIWMSITVFFSEGEQIVLRIWWQCVRTLGLENWRSYLPMTEEELTALSQSPATSAVLSCLSILLFLGALCTLLKPWLRRRRAIWTRST